MENTLTETLAPAQAALWQSYLAAEARGLRAETLSTLRAFVDALQAGPAEQRQGFAAEFCRLAADEGAALPRREPLFAGILAPSLLSAYDRGDDHAGRRLAFFRDGFWKQPLSHPLHQAAPTRLDLLREAFQQNPADARTRELLLRLLQDDFEYAVHEVPAGVLRGNKGATVAQCREEEEDLALFREVAEAHGVTAQYKAAMHKWAFHFHGYADYQTHRAEYENYATYIERHWQAEHEVS